VSLRSRRSRSATGHPGRHDTPVIRLACAASIRSTVARNGAGLGLAEPVSTIATTNAAAHAIHLVTSRGGRI
jgi:hypothetical protein